MKLAERLQNERKRIGLSQAELARIGGVRANAQGHYENGIRSPRADHLFNLHQNGIDVGFILTGVRALTSGCKPSEDEFIRNLRMLREEDRLALEKIVRLAAECSSASGN